MNVLILTGGLYPSKANLDLYLCTADPIDFVIAADSGFDTAVELGIECNIVIGDMDSILNKDKLKKIPKSSVIEFSKDKDYTDTELALFEAKKRGSTHITLVGADGGRLDHTLALLKLFEGNIYPNVWLCKEQIVFLLDDNEHNEKVHYLSDKEIISVFSIGNTGCISSEGLEWELNSVEWKKGFFSVSNRASKKFTEKRLPIRIKVQEGKFLVMISYSG